MDTTVVDMKHGSSPPLGETIDVDYQAAQACRAVAETVAPVWPLADYVAVNPYLGLTGKEFFSAREHLRQFSDCETLMPVDYYRQRFEEGQFSSADIQSAIDELIQAGVPGAELLSRKVLAQLLFTPSVEASDTQPGSSEAVEGRVRSISAAYDKNASTAWTSKIYEDIGKHCAAHYDQGQSFWPSPWRNLTLYAAWQSAMRHDRRMQVLGLGGLRALAADLPAEPAEAIAQLLEASGSPHELWPSYLLCLAYELPGWSALAQYQAAWVEGGEPRVGNGQGDDLLGLLAMRLAYDVALAKQFDFQADWHADWSSAPEADRANTAKNPAVARLALLRANEIGYRDQLLGELASCQSNSEQTQPEGGSSAGAESQARKLAQLVFCIDVRSERMRRHLERVSNQVDTLGFAGFFGIPFAYERLGETSVTNQLPVLVQPQFKVGEHIRVSADDQQAPASRGVD